jgi:hypothetical protein
VTIVVQKIGIVASGIIWIDETGSGSPIIHLILKMDILKETLSYDEAVAEVDAYIWANTQKRYLAKEIPSEVYLMEKRCIQHVATLSEKRREVAILRLDILQLARW